MNHWNEMKRQSQYFWLNMMAAVSTSILGLEGVVINDKPLGWLLVAMGFYFLFMAREEFNTPKGPKDPRHDG